MEFTKKMKQAVQISGIKYHRFYEHKFLVLEQPW